MDVARTLHAGITNPPEDATPDHTIAKAVTFDRIARAIRRTIVLARHLRDPATPRPAEQRTTARKRILRDVEDAIHRSERRNPDKELLRAELHERLDAPDLDADLLSRPIPEIIAEICRDLGIASAAAGPLPWKRRTPEDLAALCAAAARHPRSPQPPDAPPPHPPGPAADRPAEPERIFRLFATPNPT
jgi:hypothetical protein